MESPSGELAPSLSQAWLHVSKLHSRRSKVFQGAEGKLGPTEVVVYTKCAARQHCEIFPYAYAHLRPYENRITGKASTYSFDLCRRARLASLVDRCASDAQCRAAGCSLSCQPRLQKR